MAVHWTDFPERVETFGDLLSILETLDRHDAEHGFTARSFEKESLESAYGVELDARDYRFEPRRDRMPGLERVLEHLQQAHHPFMRIQSLRQIQGQLLRLLRVSRNALNQMTFVQIADALDAAVSGVQPVQPPPRVATASSPTLTFGDVLSELRGIEQAAASLRADADAMNGAVGSGHLRMQAAVYEATANYKKHPAFPRLKARVNLRFGPFVYDNLLRLRSMICDARGCGTTDADLLSLDEVVATLDGSRGATTALTPPASMSGERVLTQPNCEEPPHRLIESAMWSLPGVFNNAQRPPNEHDNAGRKGVYYAVLAKRLADAGHAGDAVQWAIHRHTDGGRLEATPSHTSTPGIFKDGNWVVKPVVTPNPNRAACILWANPTLWEWWKAIESGQISATGASSTPPGQPTSSAQQDSYTMSDLRELLRYKRKMGEFEAWQRSSFKPILGVSEYATRAHSMALNSPNPSRLTEDVANTLPVYRRLLRESLTVLKKELDESVLLYFVGEVADRQKRRIEELWPLSTEAFGCLMDEPEKAGALLTPPTEVTINADRPEPQEPAAPQPDRKLTERQKLILTEMLALGAVGSTKKTTRTEVVQRIDKKKTGADFARDFSVLKDANYTDSEPGPDGGVWLKGRGKTRAEALNKENK